MLTDLQDRTAVAARLREQDLGPLLEDLAGRHVLVAARGYDYRDDLVGLRHYIKPFRPVLIGIDKQGRLRLNLGVELARRQQSRHCAQCDSALGQECAVAAGQ